MSYGRPNDAILVLKRAASGSRPGSSVAWAIGLAIGMLTRWALRLNHRSERHRLFQE